MAKLPVLMYHNVSSSESEGLTISKLKLEEQFSFLIENKYKSYHFHELMNLERLSSKKNIVITFDDIYVNQLDHAYELLKKYELKATFFAPLMYVGKKDTWNTGDLDIMTAEQLLSLDPSVIELGFHSYYHKRFDEISLTEIEVDTQKCFEFVSENKLPLSPVHAYPYGKYPRKKSEKEQFTSFLKQQGFKYGLRIGNRVNRFPFPKPFEVQRIDIKGDYSLSKFKRNIRFGKII